METKKDVLNFSNVAIIYDYKNLGIIEELNQVRKCLINKFQETIPVSRILIALSNMDVMILKNFGNYIEIIIKNIHDLRDNILNMISFQRVVKEERDVE